MDTFFDNQEIDRGELIRYRVKRAAETLEDAWILIINGGSFQSIVNRMYFACFYATEALLMSHGIENEEHDEVQDLLEANFISPGLIDGDFGRHMNELTYAWIDADKDLFERFDPDDIDFFYKDSMKFILATAKLLNYPDLAEQMESRLKEISWDSDL